MNDNKKDRYDNAIAYLRRAEELMVEIYEDNSDGEECIEDIQQYIDDWCYDLCSKREHDFDNLIEEQKVVNRQKQIDSTVQHLLEKENGDNENQP